MSEEDGMYDPKMGKEIDEPSRPPESKPTLFERVVNLIIFIKAWIAGEL